MAAATNDLNKIIKDTAIQMPQCMQMVDEIVKVINQLGQYDVKKLKANVKNFKKISGVIEDYFIAVNEMVAELGKKSVKGKGVMAIAETLIKSDPTEVTGKEDMVYETGYALFDQTANVIFTIQKILDGIIDMTEGKKGNLLKSTRKFKKVKKIFLLATDLVFEVVQAVCEKIEKIQMEKMKKFDFETFEKFTGFFEQLHKMLKRLLLLTPLMILVILISPLILIGLTVLVFVLKGIFWVLSLLKPKSLDGAKKGVEDIMKVFGFLAIVILELVILALVIPYAIEAALMVLSGMAKLSLCLIAIFFVLWATGKIISKMKVLKNIIIMVLVILALDILVFELLLIALMLWGLQAIAARIDWGAVFKFLLMFILMIIVFAVLGWVATLCAPILVPAMLAVLLIVTAVTFIVAMLLLMAVFLWVLQYIYLDQEKIKENVKTIISTALFIIESIFAPTDEEDDPANKPWYKKLLSMLGQGIMLVLEAIMAVAFIALIFVAITFILLIAFELRILQIIDLDEDKIKENVRKVIETAMMVVNLIFYNSEKEPEDQEGKSWFRKLFEFVGGSLLQILEAIMAVVYLALILVAITFILIIAGELRLLQIIELNDAKIKENVSMVIETAQMVIESIFNPDDGENKESEKGFFRTLMEALGLGTILKIIDAIMAVAYLALIMVAILLIMFIAKTLEFIQKLELDAEKIKENVLLVIDTAQMVVNAIFDPIDDKEEDPSSKGFFRTLLEWLGMDGILQILDAIMAIAYLALILVAIYLVKYIAETLKFIQDLELDASKIEENLNTVMRCSRLVMDAIYKKDNTKTHQKDGIFRKLLKMILPSNLMEFLDAILAIGTLSVIKTAVGLVGEIAMNLAAIANLPSMKGVESKVRTVTRTADMVISAVFENGGSSIGSIEDAMEKAEDAEAYLKKIIEIPKLLNKAIKSFGDIKELSKEAEEKAVKTLRSIIKFINIFDGISSSALRRSMNTYMILDSITDMVRQISRIKLSTGQAKIVSSILYDFAMYGRFVSKTTINENTLTNMRKSLRIITDFTKFIRRNSMFFSKSMPLIERLLNIYSRFFDTVGRLGFGVEKQQDIKNVFQAITDFNTSITDDSLSKSAQMLQNYDRFLTKIDNVKIQNLETAVRLFEQMAKLSDSIGGNFDSLAESLNERIAPLLEELKITLDQINTHAANGVLSGGNGGSDYDSIKNQMLESGEAAKYSTAELDSVIRKKMKETTGITVKQTLAVADKETDTDSKGDGVQDPTKTGIIGTGRKSVNLAQIEKKLQKIYEALTDTLTVKLN